MVQLTPPKLEDSPTTLTNTITFDVEGMKCAGCVKAVERQLCQQTGVVSACVNLITAVAVVEYQPEQVQPPTLARQLTERGFTTTVRHSESNGTIAQFTAQTAQKRKQAIRQQIIDLATAAVLLVFSSLGHLHHLGGPSIPVIDSIWFHWGLATLAILLPGRAILIDGGRSLWHRMPNMNTLVGLGTLSAYLASCVALLLPQLGWECFFDEPVMLLGFILLGRTLEARARNRATASLESLIALQPQAATLVGNEKVATDTGITIPVEQVRLGEWLRVLPGEKIPVDGEVVAGETLVDESMLTGEPIPVAKQPSAQVKAGTINQSAAIVLETTKVGSETTLSQIIAAVETAQTRKAPIQQLADTVAGYFAYGVMALATLTFLFWYWGGTRLWSQVLQPVTHLEHSGMEMMTSPLLLSIKLAIAVLVVACPCTLGLATPTALLVGTSMGAEKGILIKGGDILERMQQLQTVVFDKTGTLTVGQPEVIASVPVTEITPESLLQMAAAAEREANHPLATAIVTAAQTANLPALAVEQCHTEPGLGVVAQIAAGEVLLGNETWLEQQDIAIPESVKKQVVELTQTGKTAVYLALAGELVGFIVLADVLRPDAAQTVRELQELGLEVVLLTGDRATTAEAIATQLGITKIFANILPQQKAAIIQSLQKSPDRVIAMIGDGINDAPALAQADIGISLQGATDVALETADLVLMGGKLRDLVESIQLSRATFRKICQNLWWAFGYNLVAIPIAAGILLPHWGIVLLPSVAAALMAFSSVMVVTNSLLLRYRFFTKI